MPTTAKTGTRQSKAATPDPQPATVGQSGFLPRRHDDEGNTTELRGKTWVKVDD